MSWKVSKCGIGIEERLFFLHVKKGLTNQSIVLKQKWRLLINEFLADKCQIRIVT